MANESEISEMKNFIEKLFPNKNIDELIRTKSLNIGTLEMHKAVEKTTHSRVDNREFHH